MSTSKIKMVELNEDILNNLICSECGEYLSYPPIMVKQDGDSICGRCTLDEEEAETAVRDKSYEQLAAIVLFPCRYESEGCTEKLNLTEMEEHEGCCPFRKIPCIAKDGVDCPWVGTYDKLLAHVKDKHVDLIVEHPCTAKPDLTKTDNNNWLMSMFGFLFLVQIKFKETTDELWHSVHFIGDYKLSYLFSYNFEIGNGKTVIKEDRKVISMAQYDNDFTKESSKGLVKFLGGYENTSFSVRLIPKEPMYNICKSFDPKENLKINNGVFCDAYKIAYWNKNESKKKTISELPCPNMGCIYIAYEEYSLRKHYKWLCTLNNSKCTLCNGMINCMSLMEHYKQSHQHEIVYLNITGNIATYQLQNYEINNDPRANLIVSAFNILFRICYVITDEFLHISVVSNLIVDDTKKFKLSFAVLNPDNKRIDDIFMHQMENVSSINASKNISLYDWISSFRLCMTQMPSFSENNQYIELYIENIT